MPPKTDWRIENMGQDGEWWVVSGFGKLCRECGFGSDYDRSLGPFSKVEAIRVANALSPSNAANGPEPATMAGGALSPQEEKAILESANQSEPAASAYQRVTATTIGRKLDEVLDRFYTNRGDRDVLFAAIEAYATGAKEEPT